MHIHTYVYTGCRDLPKRFLALFATPDVQHLTHPDDQVQRVSMKAKEYH